MADSSSLAVKHTRRKRPSFSPIKSPKVSLPARAHSESPTEARSEDFGIISTYRDDISSLEFNEFSLLDVDGVPPPLGSSWHHQLFQYLQTHYGVEDMFVMQPFLILRCGDPPHSGDRPFTIAGCISVWLGMDDTLPPILPGSMGGESEFEKFVEVDESLVDDLKSYGMPKPETLFALLSKNFPDAVAVSLISCAIIVEFEEIDKETWARKLESLPCGFKNISLDLTYSNGLLANAEFKRLKAPQARNLRNMTVDDSDYVSAVGSFNPGAMLCSDQEDAISAGILVRKDGEERLTVAFHCWDEEFDKKRDKLGDANHFRVLQAESTVGYVAERIQSTDIGLAKIQGTVSFSNRFLDIDGVGKVLVPSAQIQQRDQFYIDSFVTGRQHLVCAGIRVLGKKRAQDFLKDRQDNPPDGTYVIMHQGIYATNDPEILGSAKLRAGICGSVLVRLKRVREASSCLDDGEIVHQKRSSSMGVDL